MSALSGVSFSCGGGSGIGTPSEDCSTIFQLQDFVFGNEGGLDYANVLEGGAIEIGDNGSYFCRTEAGCHDPEGVIIINNGLNCYGVHTTPTMVDYRKGLDTDICTYLNGYPGPFPAYGTVATENIAEWYAHWLLRDGIGSVQHIGIGVRADILLTQNIPLSGVCLFDPTSVDVDHVKAVAVIYDAAAGKLKLVYWDNQSLNALGTLLDEADYSPQVGDTIGLGISASRPNDFLTISSIGGGITRGEDFLADLGYEHNGGIWYEPPFFPVPWETLINAGVIAVGAEALGSMLLQNVVSDVSIIESC